MWTPSRNANEAPQVQIATLIQPELRLIFAAIAKIGDRTQPDAARLRPLVRDDGQSALWVSVQPLQKRQFLQQTFDLAGQRHFVSPVGEAGNPPKSPGVAPESIAAAWDLIHSAVASTSERGFDLALISQYA